MRPLNFLHLTTFYPPFSFGGDAIQIYRLAHALGDLGHSVDVVHCEDSYRLLHAGDPPVAFPDHPNVTRHGLRSKFGNLSPLLTQQTGRPWLKNDSISRILGSKPFDVIHYHNISLLGPTALALSPPLGRPIKLYTAHEHWLVCPTHVLWKFNSAPCDKPDCLRCTMKAGRPPQLWRYTGMLDRAAAHVDRFLAPSQFTIRMHRERGFAPHMDCLPNFVNRVDDEGRAPAPRPHASPYFLFVGRLEKLKGLDTLIRVWPRVTGCDLLIAGTGTDEVELRGAAIGDPRIRFLGVLPPADLGPLYFHALGVIVPSRTYETFGLTSVEAFARKTPAIARDLGALPEIIEQSGGGFVYRTDDELLKAVQSIADSPALRAKLGDNGYAAYLRRWTREAHIEQYFGFIRATSEKKYGATPYNREPNAIG